MEAADCIAARVSILIIELFRYLTSECDLLRKYSCQCIVLNYSFSVSLTDEVSIPDKDKSDGIFILPS